MTKHLLWENMKFVMAVADALEEKETLLYSDIQKIRRKVEKTQERAWKRKEKKAQKNGPETGRGKKVA